MAERTKYRRISDGEIVEARQVTADNVAELADWCGGSSSDGSEHPRAIPAVFFTNAADIVVPAHPGQWLVKSAGDMVVELSDSDFCKWFEAAE
jgi:hypothetical protein